MRLLLASLAVLLLLVAPARAQGPDDAVAVARISGQAILAAQVRVARLARACGLRDEPWVARALRVRIRQQERDAAALGDLVQGGSEGVRWFMLGAREVASADAEAEHQRYGADACRRLEGSGHLTATEGFLAAREH